MLMIEPGSLSISLRPVGEHVLHNIEANTPEWKENGLNRYRVEERRLGKRSPR